MGDKSSVPAAPNTSAISGAQQTAAATDTTNSANQLAWAQQQGVTDQATTDDAVNDSLTQQDAINAQSATDLNTYNNTATPALGTLQTDANNYSNQGFKDQQVGGAIADQAAAADAARNNSTQALEGFGVNPASTRYGALDIGTRMTQAANEATAGTAMGQTVDATGRALQQQVYTDAQPLAAQATSESSAGTAAGTSAVNDADTTTNTGASAQGTGVQYAGLAGNADSGTANTINTGYANTIAGVQANNAASSGIGSALGMVAGVGLKAAMAGSGGSVSNGGITLGNSGGPTAFSATGGAVVPLQHAAVGGAIAPAGSEATPGGAIPAGASPTRGQAVDDVPARLTVGEFVMPKDVVAWKGQEHFQKLIDKSREQAAAATAKPAVGNAPQQQPTFTSTPQGAIPAQRAA